MGRPSALIEQREATLWGILDRPDAMNALSHEALEMFEELISRAEDDAVTAVVLTGRGPAFSSGVDLKMGAAARQEELSQFLTRLQSVYRRIELCPRPVIAAVNGLALAGGLELVLCCDLVIASRDATFGDGHARAGLVPAGGMTVRLPRRVGPSKAKEMLYTGRSFDASAMHAAGLVNDVVDPKALEDAVAELVREVAASSGTAIAVTKHLVNAHLGKPADEALALESTLAIQHQASDDAQEGLKAFRERRPPTFRRTH